MVVVFTNAILNLAWAAICLAAFAWLIAAENRREHQRARASRRTIIYRGIALSLALVSLFPCVSASDDLVRLQFLGANTTTSTPSDSHKSPASPDQSEKKALGMLGRLLEALDSVQITVALALCITLCLFSLAITESHRSLDRFLPARAGRAPPSNRRSLPI
jgi:hypothetical protein